MRHEEQLLGALVIACGGECVCNRKGLDVINLIFRQTAGTIRRAALQEEEIRDLHERVESSAEFSGIIGKSRKMRDVYTVIEKVAASTVNVLISGESGTGKELVAKAIHFNSARRNMPFVAVNCGAIPETLMESEFFGHKKGSFTGAVSDRAGLFEQAEGGTLFLDEIGEVPIQLQAKLLRVLQERCFRRIGGTEESSADVRVIAASNRDLQEQVQEGQFREDSAVSLNLRAGEISIHDDRWLTRPWGAATSCFIIPCTWRE